jgi:acylphosphatase
MLARRYFITGDVQGVGFRYFVLREAQRIGNIRGFVRNLRDGRVEAYAEAEEEELKQLEASLRKGPLGGEVSRVDVIEENPNGGYADFRVTF